MKNFLLIALLSITAICKAEDRVKIYHEQTNNEINIYADNNAFCPMSITIDFAVLNLDIDGGDNNVYVIEALVKKKLLTTLKPSDKRKAYKFRYKYLVNIGNHNDDNYDEDYAYNLPFNTSQKFKLFQGYNGAYSHQNVNALDFPMPIGTEITAIREGTVINVIETNTKSCVEKGCEKYNNFIIIYHPDGTFAQYIHIKQYGSKVKIGEKVTKGQVIGYSGNVGRSDGPHLHLVIFKQKIKERITLETKFKTGNGDTIEYLIEKNEYSRNY